MLKNNQTTSLSRHPHDVYFKTVFAKRENVIPFLNYFLSQNTFLAHKVLPLIDLDSLTFINTEIVSSTKLSKLMGDILLRFNLKKSAHYFYILLEHQSSPDKAMNMRLEEYKVQIRKQLLKIDRKVPYILTICVWAMKQAYKGATSMAEMYDSDETHKVLEDLDPLHVDFAACDTMQLIENSTPEVALVKRNIKDKEYLAASGARIIQSLEEGKYQKNSCELLYLLYRINKSEIDKYIGKDISKIPNKYREIFMSAALYYRQEGREEGLQEGKLETAKNMLQEGSSPGFIEKVTGLPMEDIRGLQIA